MLQWFALAAIAGVGYLLYRQLGTAQEQQGPIGPDVELTIGTGASVDVGTGGANQAQHQEDRLIQGASQGFAAGGIIGAAIATVAAWAANKIEGPPKPPDVDRWGLPYRPDLTVWDDVKKEAWFYIPSDNELSSIQATFSYEKLLSLFPGCSIEAIRKSGVVSWRPGDDPTPISNILYSPGVAGSWLIDWESRHLASVRDYQPPGWGDQPYPKTISWYEIWKSHPEHYQSEKDGARLLTIARRLCYFNARNPKFTENLFTYLRYCRSGHGWIDDNGTVWSKDPQQWQANNAIHAMDMTHALANSCKIYIPGYSDYLNRPENTAKVQGYLDRYKAYLAANTYKLQSFYEWAGTQPDASEMRKMFHPFLELTGLNPVSFRIEFGFQGIYNKTFFAGSIDGGDAFKNRYNASDILPPKTSSPRRGFPGLWRLG